MPGRKFGNETRYGFNGKERDKDLHNLTAYDYGFRIYNPAIGRFLSVDPLMKGYPSWSPYPYAMNRPIDGIDLDGLEWWKIFLPGMGIPFKSPGLKNTYADDVIDGFYERAKSTVMGIWDLLTGHGKGGNVETKRGWGSMHTGIANDVQNMGDPMYLSQLFTGFVEGVITDYANLIQATFQGDGKAAGALLFEAFMFMMPEGKGASVGKFADDGIIAFDQAIDAIKNGQRTFPDLEAVVLKVEPRGGAYGTLEGRSITGFDKHHIPADAATTLSKYKGGAIQIEPTDHLLTASWGNSKEAKVYRAKQEAFIASGDFRSAFEMDVNDLRSKFGTKYDKAIEETLNYYIKEGIIKD